MGKKCFERVPSEIIHLQFPELCQRAEHNSTVLDFSTNWPTRASIAIVATATRGEDRDYVWGDERAEKAVALFGRVADHLPASKHRCNFAGKSGLDNLSLCFKIIQPTMHVRIFVSSIVVYELTLLSAKRSCARRRLAAQKWAEERPRTSWRVAAAAANPVPESVKAPVDKSAARRMRRFIADDAVA